MTYASFILCTVPNKTWISHWISCSDQNLEITIVSGDTINHNNRLFKLILTWVAGSERKKASMMIEMKQPNVDSRVSVIIKKNISTYPLYWH